MKTSELSGAALDWAVAKCEGWERGKYMLSPDIRKDVNGKVIGIMVPSNRDYIWFNPSKKWAIGGPIIEREGIGFTQFSDYPQWTAKHPQSICHDGDTPLVAAMRCYVSSKLGNDVAIPKEIE